MVLRNPSGWPQGRQRRGGGALVHPEQFHQAIAELDRLETAQALAQIADAPNVIEGLQFLAQQVSIAASDPSYRAISIEVAAEAARNPLVGALFAANDIVARADLVRLLERGVRLGQVDASLNLPQIAVYIYRLQ